MEPDDLDYLLPANCPDPYFDTWDRHNSIAFSTATKGLRNAPGENNCFVNSAVQTKIPETFGSLRCGFAQRGHASLSSGDIAAV
ncbi:hypothetical protein RRG08_033105 [Elysia crispata]|uniref:Uncharacterized protein n=1 Tax=Elysia crispata TaxID=231223 RepID=A0AAE1BBH4_9GAST|nr:hypothetical protein RRG08_033105 [Elysia crispata]